MKNMIPVIKTDAHKFPTKAAEIRKDMELFMDMVMDRLKSQNYNLL